MVLAAKTNSAPEILSLCFDILDVAYLFFVNVHVFQPKFKHDAPIEERAPLSFLLGLRWQLGEWEYDKKAIKVNEETLTIKYNGQVFAHASVKSDKLVVDWLAEEWKDWKELQESRELKALVETTDKKLAQARAGKQKGKGKGTNATASM